MQSGRVAFGSLPPTSCAIGVSNSLERSSQRCAEDVIRLVALEVRAGNRMSFSCRGSFRDGADGSLWEIVPAGGRCGCPRRGTRAGDFAPGWIGSGGCGGLGYGSVGKLGTLDDASHWESEQERVTYHVDGRGLSRAGRLPGCSRDASGSQPSDL